MSADDSRGQLARAMKDLNNRWLETRASWDDVVANEFERTHLQPLELDIKSAIAAVDQAAKLLLQVRRECS